MKYIEEINFYVLTTHYIWYIMWTRLEGKSWLNLTFARQQFLRGLPYEGGSLASSMETSEDVPIDGVTVTALCMNR